MDTEELDDQETTVAEKKKSKQKLKAPNKNSPTNGYKYQVIFSRVQKINGKAIMTEKWKKLAIIIKPKYLNSFPGRKIERAQRKKPIATD